MNLFIVYNLILGKLYASNKIINVDLDKVKHLKLTEDELNYIYDEREFYPIIYDLCAGLYNVYKTNYNNLTIDKFLTLLNNECLTNDINVMYTSNIIDLYR